MVTLPTLWAVTTPTGATVATLSSLEVNWYLSLYEVWSWSLMLPGCLMTVSMHWSPGLTKLPLLDIRDIPVTFLPSFTCTGSVISCSEPSLARSSMLNGLAPLFGLGLRNFMLVYVSKLPPAMLGPMARASEGHSSVITGVQPGALSLSAYRLNVMPLTFG